MHCLRLFSALLLAVFLFIPLPASAWQLSLREWGGGGYFSRDFNLKNNTLSSTGAVGFLTTSFYEST